MVYSMGEHYKKVETETEGSQYHCQHCPFQTASLGEMVRHHNPRDPNRCANRDWETEEKEKEKAASERLDMDGMEPREIVALHGIEGLEQLMRDRLAEYLQSAPKISKKVSEWVLKQWDSDETIRRDPNLLYSALTESGVETKIAYRITHAISSLHQEYQHLLKAPPHFPISQRGIPLQGPSGYPGFPSFYPYGQPRYGQPGYGQPGPGYGAPGVYSQEQVNRMREDWKNDNRLSNLERTVQNGLRNLEDKIGQKAAPPSGPHEEIKEFVDAEGNLCDPEKAVSVRLRTIPIAQGSSEVRELSAKVDGLSKDFRDNVILKEMKSIKEEVKQLREKRGTPEESAEVKGLKESLANMKNTITDLKTTIADKDRQTFLDKISGLEDRIEGLSRRGTGQWQSDEMRAISSGISDVKDILKDYLTGGKRPMDRLENLLLGGAPPTTPVSPEAREQIYDELRRQGFTVPR